MHKRISEGASLLAIALLNVADDEGRFEADPGQIGAQLFNRRALSVPVDEALQELAEQRFLVLYVAKLDGHQTELGQILGFRDHAAPWGQVINKPSASLLPAPDKGLLREVYGSETVALLSGRKAPPNDGGRKATEPFTPSMDGRMDRKGEDGGREGQSRSALAEVENSETESGIKLRYDLAKGCLEFLNKKTGAKFPENQAFLYEIALRLHEVNYDVPGIEKMVARQVVLWGENPKMREFLRPQTLFEAEKFHGYFGQRDLPAASPGPDVTTMRRELEEKIAKSRANGQSVYHSKEATAQERDQLKNWRAELEALR